MARAPQHNACWSEQSRLQRSTQASIRQPKLVNPGDRPPPPFAATTNLQPTPILAPPSALPTSQSPEHFKLQGLTFSTGSFKGLHSNSFTATVFFNTAKVSQDRVFSAAASLVFTEATALRVFTAATALRVFAAAAASWVFTTAKALRVFTAAAALRGLHSSSNFIGLRGSSSFIGLHGSNSFKGLHGSSSFKGLLSSNSFKGLHGSSSFNSLLADEIC
ncbi:unnamed protein product [Closterium sp. NIES-54]